MNTTQINLSYRTTLWRFAPFAPALAAMLASAIYAASDILYLDRAQHPTQIWMTCVMIVIVFIFVSYLCVALPRRTVLFLTATGFKDLRSAPEEIPWTAIRSIRDEEVPINRTIILEIDPPCLAALSLTKSAHARRRARRAFAPNDLLINTAELNISRQDLLAKLKRFWDAGGASSSAPAGSVN